MPNCTGCGIEKDWFRADDGSFCPLCAKRRRKTLTTDAVEKHGRELRKWLRHALSLARKVAYRSRPENKSKVAAAGRRRWADPEHRKQASEKQRAYRLANPERVRESARKSRLARLSETRANGLIRLGAIKKVARRRDIECHLKVAWYREHIWGKPCLYCGEDCRGGIDRFDNDRSYDPDNCVPCCHWCNAIKGAQTVSEMMEHLRRILDFQAGLVLASPRDALDRPASLKRMNKIRSSAKMRNIHLGIGIEWYRNNIWGKSCHYCGLPTIGGIDRVDSSIGYDPENCVPCCTDCNRTKFTHSPTEMVARIREIVRRWNHNAIPGKNPPDPNPDLDSRCLVVLPDAF